MTEEEEEDIVDPSSQKDVALFFPRTRLHFQEIRDALERESDRDETKKEWRDKGRTFEDWQKVEKHKYRIIDQWKTDKLELKKRSITYPHTRPPLSPHRERMRFSVWDKRWSGIIFGCEYYSVGILVVENPRRPRALSAIDFRSRARDIFKGLFAGFPFVTQAFKETSLGSAWGECYFDPPGRIEVIFRYCCYSCIKNLVNKFRTEAIANRLKSPRNPEGQIWPRKLSGKTGPKVPSRQLDEQLLYAFDASEYISQVKLCINFFDSFITHLDPHEKESMQENVDFLTKWAEMRQERAESISEIERNSGQVKLGKLVVVLTYETIVLTVLQIQRTLITQNSPNSSISSPLPPSIQDFLLPWIVVILLPIIPIAVYHFIDGQDRISKLARGFFFGWEGIWFGVFSLFALGVENNSIPQAIRFFGILTPTTWLSIFLMFFPIVALSAMEKLRIDGEEE